MMNVPPTIYFLPIIVYREVVVTIAVFTHLIPVKILCILFAAVALFPKSQSVVFIDFHYFHLQSGQKVKPYTLCVYGLNLSELELYTHNNQDGHLNDCLGSMV